MDDGFLPVPRTFLRGFFLDPRGWGRIYFDWQRRAAWGRMPDQRAGFAKVTLEPGELLFNGEREEAEQYGITRASLRDLVAHLEKEGLVQWPEGRAHRRPVRMRLVDFWPAALASLKPDTGTNVRTRNQPQNVPNAVPETVPEKSNNGAISHDSSNQKPDQGVDRKPDRKVYRRKGNKKQMNQDLFPPPSEEGADEPPADGQVHESDRRHPTHRLMAVLVEVGLNGYQPRGRQYAEQAVCIKRMHEEHGPEAVETAMRRMRNLFEYSKGAAFSAFDVEKKFTRAMASAAAPVEGNSAGRGDAGVYVPPESTAEKKRAAEARHKRQMEDWRARVEERFKDEPRDVRTRYATAARQFYATLPFAAGASEERRTELRVFHALRNYGASIGDPVPEPPAP